MLVTIIFFFSYNSFYSIKERNHHLTHYQKTNFRLFQIERVCRRQFQIWRKWQKVIQMGRKHCGKRRNCSLRAISPFSPSVFLKACFPGASKGVIVWEWVKQHEICRLQMPSIWSHTKKLSFGKELKVPGKEALKKNKNNIAGKRINSCNQHFLTMFFYPKTNCTNRAKLELSSAVFIFSF